MIDEGGSRGEEGVVRVVWRWCVRALAGSGGGWLGCRSVESGSECGDESLEDLRSSSESSISSSSSSSSLSSTRTRADSAPFGFLALILTLPLDASSMT